MSTLNIALVNNTGSSTAYAYITGLAINNNNALFLLQADGHTPYFPPNPSSIGSALGVNCAIPLGGPGSTTNVVIPLIAGGRIWFSVDRPLVFLLNPSPTGPALVTPSVSNLSDPNIQTRWDFCEFTFNSAQLFANITYVDFLCLPISLSLTNTAGNTQNAVGVGSDGLDTVCAGLRAQNAADGAGWDQLIVTSGGQNLRALSPNNGIVMNPSLFSGYFDSYVNRVWSMFSSSTLTVDTQFQWGTVTGRVSGDTLIFDGVGNFGRPSARDIFSCSTGPFAVNSPEMGNIAARIAAAFNRSTMLLYTTQPNGSPADYYKDPITNHYSRILHAASSDGRGYAFPFDDVVPNGGTDQSGSVFDPNPSLLTATLGGSTGLPSQPSNPSPRQPRISAYSQIQATSYTSHNGTQTSETGDGPYVGWINNGCWLGYSAVDFGDAGATQFIARVASGAAPGISGLVQVALDSPTASPVGSFAIANTGGWDTWKEIPANITTVKGVHNVYLTFSSGQPADFVNVEWFRFTSTGQSSQPSQTNQPQISAYSQIQAASYTSHNRTQTASTSDSGGGSYVGWINNGCWLGYSAVDFGNTGATQFIARVASGAAPGISGLVQVSLDNPTASPVGSFAIANTGGWDTWKTVPTNISTAKGVHDVYLTFSSGQPADFVNVHWFTFTSPTAATASVVQRNAVPANGKVQGWAKFLSWFRRWK